MSGISDGVDSLLSPEAPLARRLSPQSFLPPTRALFCSVRTSWGSSRKTTSGGLVLFRSRGTGRLPQLRCIPGHGGHVEGLEDQLLGIILEICNLIRKYLNDGSCQWLGGSRWGVRSPPGRDEWSQCQGIQQIDHSVLSGAGEVRQGEPQRFAGLQFLHGGPVV